MVQSFGEFEVWLFVCRASTVFEEYFVLLLGVQGGVLFTLAGH